MCLARVYRYVCERLLRGLPWHLLSACHFCGLPVSVRFIDLLHICIYFPAMSEIFYYFFIFFLLYFYFSLFLLYFSFFYFSFLLSIFLGIHAWLQNSCIKFVAGVHIYIDFYFMYSTFYATLHSFQHLC